MEEPLHLVEHILGHSVEDTLYLIPFLLVTYLLMEWLEHRTAGRTQQAVRRAGVAGPVVGAVLGAIPQCGFSAAAATLYAGRVVSLGTVFAVFLSTSDEMLPIFIAEQVPLATIGAILGTKIAIGMVAGLVVDAVLRLTHRNKQDFRIHELCQHDHCQCGGGCGTCSENPQLVYQHHDDCAEGCTHEHHAHEHSHDMGWRGIVKSACIHTLRVGVFVFLITLALDAAFEIVGEDTLAQALGANVAISVFASAVVGLVPNCAASVAIAQLYVEGVLGAGAMLAGLLVAAGVGLLVLFRANRSWQENLAVLGILYGIGVVCGLTVSALGVAF